MLKPGFLALLKDPFDVKPLDIIIFDMLPTSNGNGKDQVYLADEIKERNPLRYAFQVVCCLPFSDIFFHFFPDVLKTRTGDGKM